MKLKWKKTAKTRFKEYLIDIRKTLDPFMELNGIIKLPVDIENEIAYLLAMTINCEFTLSNNEIAQFGADDIMPIQIIKENNRLNYFGKIFWLSTPKNHKCFNFQDPFYGEFEIINDTLQVIIMKFANFEIIDLHNKNWINNEVDWMYEIN